MEGVVKHVEVDWVEEEIVEEEIVEEEMYGFLERKISNLLL